MERDLSRPQNPIPNGAYDIVDNNSDTRHEGWYRLDPQDKNRFDDQHEETGRNGFRFHLGVESWGCVTCDISMQDRTEEWNVVQAIFENTSTTTVNDRRGYQWANPNSRLTVFGKMIVSGSDQVPIKQ